MNDTATTRCLPDALAESYRASGLWDDRGLADGLEASVLERPDTLAVADNQRRFSYADLVQRVHGAVAALAQQGLKAGDDDGALMPGTEVRVGSANHPQEGMLRGPQVFLGYADAGDNAAAFEDGWFRTGDLVDIDRGRLSVVGRLAEVVNRNGLKISLNEIDHALGGMPGVVEYACFAVPDSVTGERLAVAILPRPGATVTLEDIVAHLVAAGIARRKLPEELVLWNEPLPRTPSGKVIRSRLLAEAPAKSTQRRNRR